jgi:hypothetical protein
VERDEGARALQLQVYEVVKGADPATRICVSGGRNTTNEEMARVVSGRG